MIDEVIYKRKQMNDRDCANCGNRSDRGCKVWECKFKPVFSESKQPIIAELEKIKDRLEVAIWYNRRDKEYCLELIGKRISELKGE